MFDNAVFLNNIVAFYFVYEVPVLIGKEEEKKNVINEGKKTMKKERKEGRIEEEERRKEGRREGRKGGRKERRKRGKKE